MENIIKTALERELRRKKDNPEARKILDNVIETIKTEKLTKGFMYEFMQMYDREQLIEINRLISKEINVRTTKVLNNER